jgi:predicted NBD/HSP70 family sugar kinase
MQYDKKIDRLQIAQTNKYNVLRCLIREGPIHRAAIAKRMDLSLPTVMTIVDDLFDRQVVRSLGKGGFGVGKPPELLEILPDRFFYIGVDVGRTTIRLSANNAVMEQVVSLQEPTGDPFPEERFVKHLAALIRQLVKQINAAQDRILGVGVAMPGLIEGDTGQVIFSPDFGWKDIPLQSWLQNGLPWPVLVKNANHALGINESYISGEEQTPHNTFCVNLGYGIGAALVTGEELFRSSGGISGELGHIVVEKDGPLCKCGNHGCLESLASGEAIARQAEALVTGTSKLAELCGGDPAKIDARMVFEAAEAGERGAKKIIDTAVEYIGIGLAAAVNMLDPDRMILCGGLMRNGPGLFEQIKADMEKHIMLREGRRLEVSAGAGGEYSTANGACRVLMNTLWAERALPV